MSRDEYRIDPEANERAYQELQERKAFDDVFEEYLYRQEESHWGGPEPDNNEIDDSGMYYLNDEIVVNAIEYQRLLDDRQRDQSTIQNLLKQVKNLKWANLGYGIDYPPNQNDSLDDFPDIKSN